MDIRDRQKIFDLFKHERFDMIIHCAAQPSHDKPMYLSGRQRSQTQGLVLDGDGLALTLAVEQPIMCGLILSQAPTL
jgi:hypothetical protein